jgi:hypothetical protein
VIAQFTDDRFGKPGDYRATGGSKAILLPFERDSPSAKGSLRNRCSRL